MQELFDAVWPQAEYLLRIIVAAVCGLIIGLERENRLKDAGIRTHLMVSLASALMMIVSKYGFFDLLTHTVYGDLIKLDPSRVAAGIVTGIGFIGAGTIFVRKQVVSGLTTAAGLWATVGVGMAIGAGMYAVGIASTIIILLWQILLHRQFRFFSNVNTRSMSVRVQKDFEEETIAVIRKIFDENKIEIVSFKSSLNSHGTSETEMLLKFPRGYDFMDAVELIKKVENISSVEI